jgi:hypothetical protein
MPKIVTIFEGLSGNKWSSSGHEIVLNTRIKGPEIKLCEASADKIVQDREGRGDFSNDSKVTEL